MTQRPGTAEAIVAVVVGYIVARWPRFSSPKLPGKVSRSSSGVGLTDVDGRWLIRDPGDADYGMS